MSVKSFRTTKLQKWIFLPTLLIFFNSCGLKYVPTESPDTFEQKRQQAVEQYVIKEMESQQKKYSSIAFTESQIIKPLSYQKLDSLYLQKYQNESKNQLDLQLEENIERQRIITLNDTNKVIYIENHIFSLGLGDTIEFYTAQFQINKELFVEDVILKESVYLPKHYNELYKEYLFEESFLYPGNFASSDELNFYTFFKQPLENFSKPEKDAFILHTLKLMELAGKKNSLKTNDLLKAQTSTKFHGNSYENFNEIFSEINEIIQLDQDGKEVVVGYEFEYSSTEKATNTSNQISHYKMEFDSYLKLIKATLI
jgi:hypothetical protein